jgi:hypothetical protein
MGNSQKSKGILLWTGRWALLFCGVAVLVKLIWMFIVPSIFPGAVSKGFIVASLSWLTAIKIGIIVVLIMLIRDVVSRKINKNHKQTISE